MSKVLNSILQILRNYHFLSFAVGSKKKYPQFCEKAIKILFALSIPICAGLGFLYILHPK